MDGTKAAVVLLAAALTAGCRGGWVPWSTERDTRNYTPPGATVYACATGGRLYVRFESDGKSAWVIQPDREFRLDRVASASGQQYANATTTLALKEEEALLQESGKILFSGCKREK
jgi:membrane-bound inhibitor of C-type lysozyme